MKAFEILFAERDFKNWTILVNKLLKYGHAQYVEEQHNNPNTFFALVRECKREDDTKQIEEMKAAYEANKNC